MYRDWADREAEEAVARLEREDAAADQDNRDEDEEEGA